MFLKDAQINGKAALIKEQLDDRISKGAKTLEIQLLDEIQAEKDIDLSLIDNVNISAVHMPLINGEDYNIEDVEGRKIFKKVCALSSQIANIKNYNIIVVVHTATPPFILDKLGILYDVILVIREMLASYTNIEIAIENCTLYNFVNKQGLLHRQNATYIQDGKIKMANVELAKMISHQRCGVCFDTCHALMTETHLMNDDKLFENYVKRMIADKRIFTELFEQSASFLKLIHLAYSENHGYDEYHGKAFTGQEFIVLKYINSLYNKNNLNCPVTIEVYEKNLNDAKNYKLTIEQIDKL